LICTFRYKHKCRKPENLTHSTEIIHTAHNIMSNKSTLSLKTRILYLNWQSTFVSILGGVWRYQKCSQWCQCLWISLRDCTFGFLGRLLYKYTSRLHNNYKIFKYNATNLIHLFILASTGITTLKEEFKDTKGAIRIRISKNRQHNDQKKSTKGQTTIYKTYI
jgi:hypothetical protein